MKNKVLVKLFVPELDSSFDTFIPINEVVWKVKRLLAKSVSDLSGGVLDVNTEYTLINKLTSEAYDNNSIVYETDIKNATELILLSVKQNNSIGMVTPNANNNVNQNEVVDKKSILDRVFKK